MTDKEKQRELIVEIMKADEQSGLYDEPKVKLYTEEQLKKAVDKAIGMWLLAKSNKQEILDSLTPIELPSDEEIMQVALEETRGDINMQIAFNNGAVYICKLIEGQFNTKEK